MFVEWNGGLNQRRIKRRRIVWKVYPLQVTSEIRKTNFYCSYIVFVNFVLRPSVRCIRLVAILLLHAILTNVVRPVYEHKGALFISILIKAVCYD